MPLTDLEALNQRLQQQLAEAPCTKTLEQYVLSELLSPIEDYSHAVEVICQYLPLASERLLLVGAEAEYFWPSGGRRCLEQLTQRFDQLSPQAQAIVCYLKGMWLSQDESFRGRAQCRWWLRRSVSYPVQFVYNRLHLARQLTGSRQKKLYIDALRNVACVIYPSAHHPLTFYLNPDEYIQEFLLGTHLPATLYQSYREEAERVCGPLDIPPSPSLN